MEPNNAGNFRYLGITLGILAKITNEEMLFRKSIEKLDRAVQLMPDDAVTFHHLGTALGNLARKKKMKRYSRKH